MVQIKKLEKIKDISIKNRDLIISKPIIDALKSNNLEITNYQSKTIQIKKLQLQDNSKKELQNYKKSIDVKDNFVDSLNKSEQPDTAKVFYENSQNDLIQENLSFQIEKRKLEIISADINKKDLLNSNYNIIGDSSNLTVDEMLGDLNKQTKNIDESQPFLEMISFLDDKPKISKIPITNLDVSNLYAKIDDIAKKGDKSTIINTEYINQNKIKSTIQSPIKEKNIDIIPLLEKIDIPEILTLNDDTKISDIIKKEFVSNEKKAEKDKLKDPSFIIKNKKLEPNPEVEEKIKNIKIKAEVLKISTPLDYKKPEMGNKLNIQKKESFDYILPTDYNDNLNSFNELDIKKNKFKNNINLIYDTGIKLKELNKSDIREKYNIDEFTFVDVSYQNDTLFYNIIQPELTKAQEELYLDVKKIFLDLIDTNYYSFKGDKQGINNYIKKIFELTIEKLSFDITALEKKLYFNFIKQEFSGLGFLASVLDDKNIIEVNCSGSELPIMVYHIKYGALQTNLKFDKISQLNLFVLALTKVMGVRVNSTHPVINGYLPNGYKIEGIYSVGDLSNKGSSFIIKKYLEEPLTPNSLINLGVGAIDLFSYIWCAIDQDYQIILTGGDSVLLINSIAQLYPNKKITSIQSYDYLKLPQKNWIKKIIFENSVVSRKTILNQTLSERPDYLIVDNFSTDLFDVKWYDINLTYVDTNLLSEYVEKVKSIGIDAIVINLDRIKSLNFEQMQISKITEIQKGKEQTIIEYNKEDFAFHINLVPSNINIVDFNKKLKLLRWLLDSDISDYLDFNNIINDYYIDKSKLFKKLNILEKE